MSNNKNKYPFKILGRDKDSVYYFLSEETGTILKLTPTQFNKKNFFDLAPLSFWEATFPRFMKNKDGDFVEAKGFDEDQATDELMRLSQKTKYSIGKFRAAGFWKDDDRIVYNSGDKDLCELIEYDDKDEKGKKVKRSQIKQYKYNEFQSDFYYMISDRQFPKIGEKKETSIDDEGQLLEDLFVAQSFKSDFEAKFLMGWSLIAPFGTLLKWRPHVWISGQKARGKSWLFENIIAPLGCGTEFSTGSSATHAALRRSLGENGGFAIIDEMDGRGNKKISEKIDDIIELVKNASSDTSGVSHLVINGKTETFKVNQMFCLVAIIPMLEGAAIESRIVNVELDNKTSLNGKIDKTTELLNKGFFDNPKRFFNRTFYSLFRIFRSMEIIHNEIKNRTGESRKADNVAPCLAAWHHAKCTDIITIKQTKEIVGEYIADISKREKPPEDYDTFFHVLFNGKIRTINGTDVSISKMLMGGDHYKSYLKGIGIVIKGEFQFDEKTQKVKATGFLYISTKSTYIKELMKKSETYFSGNYSTVLRNHPAYMKSKTMRMDKAVFNSCEMMVGKIAEMYFMADGDVLDDLPF